MSFSVSDLNKEPNFFGFAHLINAMRRCSKLIVGRIHKAVGGGVGIALLVTMLCYRRCEYQVIRISNRDWSFVIEPAVSRKIGKTAMTT
jgi:methylglutaconyl-CoA hydratase